MAFPVIPVFALMPFAFAQSLYFTVNPICAIDNYQPFESHSVNFTVSNPTAVYEFGGSAPANCEISWTTCPPPTCWTTCTGPSGGYYARIAPGSYDGANHYVLDVWQAYVYELANHNNATVEVQDGGHGYRCYSGANGELNCEIEGPGGFNATVQQYYGGSTPTGGSICGQD